MLQSNIDETINLQNKDINNIKTDHIDDNISKMEEQIQIPIDIDQEVALMIQNESISDLITTDTDTKEKNDLEKNDSEKNDSEKNDSEKNYNENPEDHHMLSDTFVYWYHALNDNNWEISSYKKICQFKTVEFFWGTYDNIPDASLAMFFLMREKCPPIWEDPINSKGGYWSFKVTKKISHEAWREVSMALVGNYLTKKVEDMDLINGISISPKYNTCIIKIWINDNKKNEVNLLKDDIPLLDISHCIYKEYSPS